MISLVLDDAFVNEQALRETIAKRQVCFDHDPFYVRDGSDHVVQIGFQLNLYAAFQDPRHLPLGDDPELQEMVGELRRLCRVFFQSLDPLKPCQHPHPPMHRVLYSPERRYRAEVCLQIPIFDRAHYGAKPDRRLEELLATAECLLTHLGARRGQWDERGDAAPGTGPQCEDRLHASGVAVGEAAERTQRRG